MRILTDEQHQLLAFVDTCNRNGYRPTPTEVLDYLTSPAPAEARYETRLRRVQHAHRPSGLAPDMSQAMNAWLEGTVRDYFKLLNYTETLRASVGRNLFARGAVAQRHGGSLPRTERVQVAAPETSVGHLTRIGWLSLDPAADDSAGRLRVTPLGAALLLGAERGEGDDMDVSVVVLGRDDPLAYPLLIGQLAGVGEGLLVDPFLRIDQLHQLVVSTQLDRLLLTGKPPHRAHREAIRTYLDSPTLSRRIEVRASEELHDRLVLVDNDAVFTLGTSLNGVGRTTTVFSPMPAAAAAALREEYARIWETAELVGPTAAPHEPEDDPAPPRGQSEGV